MKYIFVFAHPDDESFSSAGTIAKLTKGDNIVKLITATRGEAGQVGEPPVCEKENLGKVREYELRRAAKILGVSEVFFLDFIDATLKDFGKKLESEIFSILKTEKPNIVITFDKTGVSNHPDHIAVSIAATSAFGKYKKLVKKHVKLYHATVPKSYLKAYEEKSLSYNAFGKMLGTEDEDITTIVDISDTFNKKVEALKSHRTQNKDWERYLKRSGVVNLKREFFKLILENRL